MGSLVRACITGCAAAPVQDGRAGAALTIAPTRLLLAAGLLLGTACGASTSPTEALTGLQYLLVRIDSDSLPVVAYATPPDTTFLTYEFVSLRDDGIAAFVREHRTVSPGAAARTERIEFNYRWTRSGEATIMLSPGFVCFAAPCGISLTGTVTDSTLRLVQSEPVTRVFHYMRLPAADLTTTGLWSGGTRASSHALESVRDHAHLEGTVDRVGAQSRF